MVIFLVMLFLLCIFGMKFSGKTGFEDYMSAEKTGAIKGIFVIIVLLSHLRQYIRLDKTAINTPYLEFMSFLGQLMVVVFLFYSGYGVLLGLRKKEGYALSLIKNRVPKVFIHFDIAILIFFFVGLLIGKNYTIKNLLLSFVGIEDVGNSVWFIIVILLLYIITFAVFIFTRKKILLGVILTTVASAALVLVVRHFKAGEYWWYDTIMCYPLGMWYAVAKPKIDKMLLPDFSKWFGCMAASVVAFAALRQLRAGLHGSRAVFAVEALAFAAVIVFASMRISVGNPVLRWFGNHVFSVYILQRIPMSVLSSFGMNSKPFLFSAACFAITIVIAELFDRMTDRLDIALKLSKKR